MRIEKPIAVIINPVYGCTKSNTEAFIDLILAKERENKRDANLECDWRLSYNKGVVLSDIHASKEVAS